MTYHRTLGFAAAIACAGLLQVGSAAAQIKTETIDYRQGDTALEGYLAYDGNIDDKRPGVLMVHRRDGMSDLTRTFARDVAKLGYVVFAADIFGKDSQPKDDQESRAQSSKFNKDRPLMRARAQAGLDVLLQHPMVDASHIATIGYCFGGTVVMELGHTGTPMLGMVTVHGSFRGFTPGAAKNIQGRVLILHGSEDTTAPLSEVELVINELRQSKVDWEYELYGGATHGFTKPVGLANERANARSWDATKRFFAEVFNVDAGARSEQR